MVCKGRDLPEDDLAPPLRGGEQGEGLSQDWGNLVNSHLSMFSWDPWVKAGVEGALESPFRFHESMIWDN